MTGAIGVTFANATSLTVGRDTEPFPLSGSLTPVLTVGFHYRTARFDLGVLAGSMGSGEVRGLVRDRELGHKWRVAASVRWRYIDADWGALFLRISPGVAILSHSDAMRSEVALALSKGRDQIEGVDTTTAAFSLGASLGFTIGIFHWLSLTLELEIATTVGELEDGTSGVRYTAIQPIFAIGFEARL